jgi:hypothetical protein
MLAMIRASILAVVNIIMYKMQPISRRIIWSQSLIHGEKHSAALHC